MPHLTEVERPKGIHINELNIKKHAATSTGRPIAERTAHKKFLEFLFETKGIRIGSVRSPYTDSRKDTKMNDEALNTFGEGGTQQMCDSFAWLREKYFTYIRTETPQQLTGYDLLNIALIGEALPQYLILRATDPIDRMNLPEIVGNISKASIGFRVVAEHTKGHTYRSPHELYEIADRNHLFQHKDTLTRFSCPANESWITKTANAIVFGKGADLARSLLSEYISNEEFGDLVDFSEYYFKYHNATLSFIKGKLSQFGINGFYAQMADLQERVNVALGRDPDSILPPTHDELDALKHIKIITPKGGPIYIAQAETHDALVGIHREKATLASTNNHTRRHQRITRNNRGKKR